MVTKRFNMSSLTLFIMVIIIGVVAGCAPLGGNGQNDSSKIALLTAEELGYFNGDEFFNGDYMNIRNQFLSSLYNAPEEINLHELFYCGSGFDEESTVEERASVVALNKWDTEPDCYCTKISRSNMDKVLTKYMGLTLADTEKTGLDNFTYLEQYDAYYSYHGDTNYRRTITFTGGEKEGDIVRLFYDDIFMVDGKKILTLKEQNGAYIFVSNERTTPALTS